jgi:hypothetical protein
MNITKFAKDILAPPATAIGMGLKPLDDRTDPRARLIESKKKKTS